MSVTDELLGNAQDYADGFDKGDLPLPPARKVAVVACMDARLDPQKVLGLAEGDAHVIRNAGGVVTDDAIRSLAISQRLLGTEEVILIHHTGCGMLTFNDDDFKRSIQDDVGLMPTSSWIDFLNPSSLKVSMPHSVWWMRTISSVPSSRCEMASERMASSVTTPPALRMTWASPSPRPSAP